MVKTVVPKKDPAPCGKVYGAYLGSFGPVLTRLAPLKADCCPLGGHLGPFWAVLAASGCAPKMANFGPKIAEMHSPKNVPRPFGKKVNGEYSGQFGPVLRGQGLELSTSQSGRGVWIGGFWAEE